MVKQIEPTDKKFIESFELDEWEIETEDGWKDITHLHKTVKYDVWQLETLSYSLKCADDHIVMVEGMKEKFVKDLTRDDKVITKSGLQKVISTKKLNIEPEEMFDLTVNSQNHTLFTNGILSHNSTLSSIFLLWYVLFNKDKTVAMMANKEGLAIELLDKIKLAYQQLPKFLQQGVDLDGWNKKKLSLENGSRIIAAATSSSALTGYTINLLYLDEFAKVPEYVANDFIASVYPVVTSGKSSKIIMCSCVVDDSFIFTAKGLRQIEDLIDKDKQDGYVVNDYSVCGRNGLNDGNVMFNNGQSPTKIINTIFGEIECSLEHKFWSCQNGNYGWVKSKDLKVGDFIPVKYGMELWGNNDYIGFKSEKSNKKKNVLNYEYIDEKLAYFLGLFLAEGSVYKRKNKNGKCTGGNVTITCGDDVSGILDELGFSYYYDGRVHYNICIKDLILLLEHLGFDLSLKAKLKYIPNKLLSMSRKNIIAMLSGMFDGDGSSHKNKGTVSISFASKKLLKQVQMLLLNLGILSEYFESITPPTERVKVFSNAYILNLSRKDSFSFYNNVGFGFERKQKNLESLNWLGERRNSHDLIPYSKSFLKDNYSNDMRKLAIFKGKASNNHFSRMILLREEKKIRTLNNELINDFFDDNLSSDMKWFPIKSIRDGYNNVYDFSLPDVENDKWCHSVIYNGFVGHQTPLGMNHFYNFWVGATRKDGNENSFFPIKVGWWEIPSRDEKFKQKIIKDIGLARWEQEYACAQEQTIVNIRDIETKKEEKVKIGDIFKDKRYN